jgi:hypothetical protein
MRLTMQVKDGKFLFDYEISKVSRGSGEQTISADTLSWFSNALEHCHQLWMHKSNKEFKDIEAKAYLEMHPEVYGEFFAKYPERLKEFKVKKQPTPREG